MLVAVFLFRNIMIQLELKVLTHLGQFIDANLLEKGLYSTSKPTIYNSNDTIDGLIERGERMKDMVGNSFISESYFENLAKCELSKFTLIDKSTINILENALQCYFNDANQNLQRKDLGDIEKSNYQFAITKAKEVMDGLGLL